MIRKPKCRHPGCYLTGPAGRGRICIATTRYGNCFCAARQLPSTHGLRGRTYYCLLGLLAVTGLRISEARNLQTEDVDSEEGILTVRGAKFGKSRLVPIHPSTRKVLSDYAARRDHFLWQAARLPLFRIWTWDSAGWR